MNLEKCNASITQYCFLSNKENAFLFSLMMMAKPESKMLSALIAFTSLAILSGIGHVVDQAVAAVRKVSFLFTACKYL